MSLEIMYVYFLSRIVVLERTKINSKTFILRAISTLIYTQYLLNETKKFPLRSP